MVRQNVIGAPEHKLITLLAHLCFALCCQLQLLIRRTRLPAGKDGPLIVLAVLC